MGKKFEQIRKSKDDCYPIPGRIAIKYRQSTAPSSEDGSRLVTIYYDEDGHIDEDKTYANWWLKEKKLGQYRSSNRASSRSSSSGGGLRAAAGAGVVGLAKKAFEESPEKKAEREQRIAENSQINKIVDYEIGIFKKNIKQEYPKTGTTEELVERIKTLIEQAEEYKLEEKHPDKLTAELAEAKKKATAWLAFKLCKQVKKQDPERVAQPDMKALIKKASRYSGRSLIIGIVIFYILIFLFVGIVCSSM